MSKITVLEIENIFCAGWFGLGRSDQVKEVGDFQTRDTLGQALILLRDRDGALWLFANSCRHRAASLLDGAEAKIEAYHNRLDAALAEDVPVLENQQKGLAHPDVMQGPFHPLLEANVAKFAQWYAEKMLSALISTQP